MKLLLTTKKELCSNSDCQNVADYKIVSNNTKRQKELYICKQCLKKLYESIGRVLIPTSPTAPFKPKKQKIGEDYEIEK